MPAHEKSPAFAGGYFLAVIRTADGPMGRCAGSKLMKADLGILVLVAEFALVADAVNCINFSIHGGTVVEENAVAQNAGVYAYNIQHGIFRYVHIAVGIDAVGFSDGVNLDRYGVAAQQAEMVAFDADGIFCGLGKINRNIR